DIGSDEGSLARPGSGDRVAVHFTQEFVQIVVHDLGKSAGQRPVLSVGSVAISVVSSQLVETPRHPVAAFAERLNARLDDLAEQPLLTMTPAENRDTLVAVAHAEAKVGGLKLRLLAHADATGACLDAGAADAAGWMRVET